MDIIPAIDLIGGKCVRLIKGNYENKKIYPGDPVEMAKVFEDHGLKRLHLVDLEGALKRKVIHWKVLENIAFQCKNLMIDFGGGIQSNEDIRIVFESGAHMATLGSMAVKNDKVFQEWVQCYGVKKILLGADVKNERIAFQGWKKISHIHLHFFLNFKCKIGLRKIFCTDIDKDGLLSGPSIDLYKKIIEDFPHLELIASGGIKSLKDLDDLQRIGCRGAIIGKIFFERKDFLKSVCSWIEKNKC
jgi:phosphoribosylformimino-5-aminoimidazole carboxamide ribotide isomerase